MSESDIRKMPANSVPPGGSPAPSNEGSVHAIPFDLGEEGDVAFPCQWRKMSKIKFFDRTIPTEG